MVKTATTNYEPVNAFPVKSFFVTMLTRDIKLEDSILDLLDNCVDGILRGKPKLNSKKPYDGFFASIEFKKDSFTIHDNCGGIPWSAHEYAFRMGRSAERPKDVNGTVGAYGIGMKRAIFKLGKQCLISTQNNGDGYEIEIDPDWIDSEEWKIPVKKTKQARAEDGTTIYVTDLYENIRERFAGSAKAFESDLDSMISAQYAFIIEKGLKISINGRAVTPKPTRLQYDTRTTGLKPFIYQTSFDDIDIFLTVGFTRPIPSDEDSVSDEELQYSSLDAGWTVLCNDRAVVYCDRSELTGWGDAGIPRYHTQFIAISGIVEFKAKSDSRKLPTTTTKRGIDSSSIVYLRVKNKMREGMKIFIDYTNQWKGRSEEAKKYIESGKALTFEEIKLEAKKTITLHETKKFALLGKQYRPTLPSPKEAEKKLRRISFTKNVGDIELVAKHLLGDAEALPSSVGERCFDLYLYSAKS